MSALGLSVVGKKAHGETACIFKCNVQTPGASGIFHVAAQSQLRCYPTDKDRLWTRFCIRQYPRCGCRSWAKRHVVRRRAFSKCDVQTPGASGIFHVAAQSQLLCYHTYVDRLWTRFCIRKCPRWGCRSWAKWHMVRRRAFSNAMFRHLGRVGSFM